MDINSMTPGELREMAKQLNELAKAKTAEQKPEKPKKKRKKRALPKVLKPEQAEAFIGAIDLYKLNGIRDRCLIEIMLKAGLRVSEVVNLRPADVDFKKGVLYVQLGKGSKDRKVSIGSTLIGWLKKWSEIRSPEAETFFHTRTNKPLTTRHIQYICADASRKSRVYVQDGKKEKNVNPHVLRATYATNLLNAGFNIKEVQLLLGWENISTSEHYLTVDMMDLDKKIKGLDKDKEADNAL